MAFTREFDKNKPNITPLPTWEREDTKTQERSNARMRFQEITGRGDQGKIPTTPSNSPSCVPYFQSERILEDSHLTEWLSSAVDEEIIRLNVKSLEGYTPYDYLLYSPKISRRNDGRLRDFDLKRYSHIEYGGWWCNGIDPLDDWKEMQWGCFKPNSPRNDLKKINKVIKYEHPPLERHGCSYFASRMRFGRKSA
ncbi:MAG: hypothetical protein HC874_11625 [Richelia sp. SL_2_1]|nr:hypothetical protein [Richelia sp. SL_2_1]